MIEMQQYFKKLLINPNNGWFYFFIHTGTTWNASKGIMYFDVDIKAAKFYPHGINYHAFSSQWPRDKFDNLVAVTPTTLALYGPPEAQGYDLRALERDMLVGARQLNRDAERASWWSDELDKYFGSNL